MHFGYTMHSGPAQVLSHPPREGPWPSPLTAVPRHSTIGQAAPGPPEAVPPPMHAQSGSGKA